MLAVWDYLESILPPLDEDPDVRFERSGPDADAGGTTP